MIEALIASLALVLGLTALPAAAAKDDVPILANKIIINEAGRPVEMVFDPARYGSGLELAAGIDQSLVPSTCLFGNRDAKHEDASVTATIYAARDKAEASTGRQVARVTYCKLEPIAVEIHGFKSSGGMVRLPWHSLWGEKRTFRMWYSVNDDTILLFSFAGDA